MKYLTCKTTGTWLICLLAVTLFSGCSEGEHSPKGFRLPEGNASNGRTAFIDLNCTQCHAVSGKNPVPEPAEPREISIVLGGEITRVKTYGELVTSIINPSHVIRPQHREKYKDADGKSTMPVFSKKMTVQQMIDIVEFLQARYDVVIPPQPYSDYGYGP